MRMSVSLKKEVGRLWKAVSRSKSEFYRAAIDAGADLDLNTFYEAFQHFQDGKASVSDGVSLSERHIDLLEDRVKQVAERLKKPKRARKNKRSKVVDLQDEDKDPVAVALDEPSLSAVVRVMLRLFIDSLPRIPDLQAKLEQLRIDTITEGLFSNPILIKDSVFPGEVLRKRPLGAGVLVDLPEGGEVLCVIDASALFAATVGITADESKTGESPRFPASPLAKDILFKAVRGKIELVVFRPEVVRYCQLLFEALEGNCAESEKMREEVVTKGRLIMNSGLKVADIEPAAVVRAAELPQSLPRYIKLMVAQLELMAVSRKVVVVSCSRELVGLSPDVLVWHPNDPTLSPPPAINSGVAVGDEKKPNGLMINNRPPDNKPRSVKKRFPVKPRPVKKRRLIGKKRFPHKRGDELETPSFAKTSSLVSEIDIPF